MWRRLRQIGLHHRPFPQQLTVGSAIGWAENPQSWSWDQKPSLSLSLPLSTWCWAESRANAGSTTRDSPSLLPEDALKYQSLQRDRD